jgi:hypothetical protein
MIKLNVDILNAKSEKRQINKRQTKLMISDVIKCEVVNAKTRWWM